MTKTITVTPQAIALIFVKSAKAEDLDREETAALMRWCDCQTEDLWDGLSLQSILNIYRVSAEWQTWEDWRSEEFDEAGRAWNRAVIGQQHHLEFPTMASRRRTA